MAGFTETTRKMLEWALGATTAVGFLMLILCPAAANPAERHDGKQKLQEYSPKAFEKATKDYLSGNFSTANRRWFELAQANDSAAQYNIGLMYYYGQGVRRDALEAMKWFLILTANGRGKARAAIQRLTPVVEPFLIAEARTRAERWLRKREASRPDAKNWRP